MKTLFRINTGHPILLFCFVLVSCLRVSGQDVSLQLRTSTGRTEFHVGEVILLDLLFVATVPNTYERNGGVALPESYPLPDSFLIEPHEGWTDPLREYRNSLFKAMHSGNFPMSGSGLSAEHILGQEPFILSLILNDYIRFTHAGRYVIQVQDSGVSGPVQRSVTSGRLTLTSNKLELIILPADSGWQRNQMRQTLDSLAQLQAAIDSHARSYGSSLSESCVSLRAMGTPEAGATMVDALRDEDLFSTCSFQVGILEFPDPKFILERLRGRFKDPNVPVTYTFLDTMAKILVLAEGHGDQLFGPDQEKIYHQLEQQLLSVVPVKRGRAKIESINTLVTTCFAAYGGAMGESVHVAGEPSHLNNRVLQVATANYQQLSPGAQNILRNYRKARGLETPQS